MKRKVNLGEILNVLMKDSVILLLIVDLGGTFGLSFETEEANVVRDRLRIRVAA